MYVAKIKKVEQLKMLNRRSGLKILYRAIERGQAQYLTGFQKLIHNISKTKVGCIF